MEAFIPEKMTAAAIDHFGGPEVLQPQVLPVPRPHGQEVLIRLEAAGIGAWDPGADGVALVRSLGADAAADGRRDDLAAAARGFAPEGLDAALVFASGESLQAALAGMRKGGKIAHPNGVEPVPASPGPGIEVIAYDGVPSPDIFNRLNAWISAGPFHVELGQTYALEDAARAHREIDQHHLGKRALRIHAH